jgi:hypothetical protein
MGGAGGVAGLRHLIMNAAEEGLAAKACTAGADDAVRSLSYDLRNSPEAEAALRDALFVRRGYYAGTVVIGLIEGGRDPKTVVALDKALAMASKGELDLDESDISFVREARAAVADRLQQ